MSYFCYNKFDNVRKGTISFHINEVEYDASGYVNKHSGGKEFLDNMKAERKDFTEYFKLEFY